MALPRRKKKIDHPALTLAASQNVGAWLLQWELLSFDGVQLGKELSLKVFESFAL